MDAIEVRAATPDDAEAIAGDHDHCSGRFTVRGHQLVEAQPPGCRPHGTGSENRAGY
jgi:hypothetical protein